MRFAKVDCRYGNHLRDWEFCVKLKEKKRMKKIDISRLKPLRVGIFAVRRYFKFFCCEYPKRTYFSLVCWLWYATPRNHAKRTAA